MSVGKWFASAAFAALLSSSITSVARAEPPREPAPAARAEWVMEIFDVTRFVSSRVSLDGAWAHAVQAVLDDMRALLEAERAAALAASTPPKKRLATWSAPLPASTNGVGSARKLVRLEPLPIEPVTQSVADVRGQSGVLLGVRMEMPWTMP